MLIERVFTVGGVLCIVLGVLLVYGFAITGIEYLPLFLAGAIAIWFGALFVAIGRDARRHRRALVDLPAPRVEGEVRASSRR